MALSVRVNAVQSFDILKHPAMSDSIFSHCRKEWVPEAEKLAKPAMAANPQDARTTVAGRLGGHGRGLAHGGLAATP